jgi:hypothetical protein
MPDSEELLVQVEGERAEHQKWQATVTMDERQGEWGCGYLLYVQTFRHSDRRR